MGARSQNRDSATDLSIRVVRQTGRQIGGEPRQPPDAVERDRVDLHESQSADVLAGGDQTAWLRVASRGQQSRRRAADLSPPTLSCCCCRRRCRCCRRCRCFRLGHQIRPTRSSCRSRR